MIDNLPNREQDGKQKILIVDDERFNIRLLNGLLKDQYKIMVSTTGRQAMTAAKEKQPDLILLDVVMPSMDGFTVCKTLKKDDATKDIPIIFITDMSDSQYETRAFEVGAVDYITKPFNHAVVMARVNTHMQLKRKTDLLENLAMLDGLTMIPNRRTFDLASRKEWERCLRKGEELSIIMIDIDHFKMYNDHFGHGVGDSCLKAVSHILERCTRRPGDIVARYGGEEFAAILPCTDLEGAMLVGELFRSSVQSLKIEAADESVSPVITISVGVCTAQPGQMDSLTCERLIDNADKQLYRAKELGRNQVAGEQLY